MTIDEIVAELIRQRITVEEINYALVRRALFHYGNITFVSRNLGISKPTVMKRMRELGITPKELHSHYQRKLRLKA